LKLTKLAWGILAIFISVYSVLLYVSHTRTIDIPEQATTYGSFINIYGETVELSDYFGKYLWVDYAAEWCSYCNQQTETLKLVASQFSEDMDFLTIVTGTSKVMEAPDMHSIRQWSDKHHLDPRMVIARFYTDRLPYNLLYSPEGKILYRGSGLLQKDEIEKIIYQYSDL